MRSTKTKLLVTLASIAAFGIFSAQSDQIKMKDGTTHEGRITLETDDIVKIEVSISASIKETKLLSRKDILNITKDDPADLEFNRLQGLIPTGSLMSADAYKSLIETGPNAFLTKYPDSSHVEPVKKIKATLEEELDKVERGFIKVYEDWVSPQEEAQFPELVRSRIGLLRMQRIAKGGNHNSIIGAMREFENIEENYYGTPAFPRAVELAKQLLPNLGAQLQRMSRDVDYRNAEFERTKAQMDEIARQGIDAARAREEAQYQAGLAADKEAGIRWVRLNVQSKASIDGYFKMASDEMKSLNAFDIEGLKKQSEALKEVDELIAKNNFLLAESKLEDAAKIPTRINADPKKKYSKKGSKGSYLSTLKTKLNQQKAKQEELAKAQEEAAKSQALSKNMKSDKSDKKDAAEGEGVEAAASGKDKQKAAEEALLALAASAPQKKEEEEKASKSKTKSKKSSKRDEDEDEKEEKRERVRSSGGGGGISITRIIQIGTVILLIAVVAFKYLGIGGNKE
ncbi:hypothetical protein N9L71_07565 [Verrucomicrobiales bacterium]|nr:hypothetical protein [Verrucomicrobiales bacterium]